MQQGAVRHDEPRTEQLGGGYADVSHYVVNDKNDDEVLDVQDQKHRTEG